MLPICTSRTRVLSVGFGAIDSGFDEFAEVTDRKTRAELLDEDFAIVTGPWRGQPFNYTGKHYSVRETSFMPPAPPVQQPRIPLWVVSAWPRMRSMRRVLRYDGLLPTVMNADGSGRELTPDDLSARRDFVSAVRRTETPFDIVLEGVTPGDGPAQGATIVARWAEAGATWWIESRWEAPDQARVLHRIQQGPPRLT